MRLKDKVAVICGASDEFAQAIALGYAREGAKLYLQDFADAEKRLARVEAEVRKATPHVASGLFDIARAEPVAAMTRDIMARHGQIDILVNASSGGWHGMLFDAKEGDWDKAIDRGLKAYFLTSQAIGKEMARRGSGKIINITSIVGKLGSGGAIVWGAARGGVDAMTAALAQGLGQYGINVVALARGASDMTPYPAEAKAERLRRLPFGRLGNAEDIVGPAIFLATEEARWIAGSVIYCDGGYVTAAATDAEHRVTEVPYRGP
ncbi:MAG TPA: SDR family oxidoreductase [Stellaceae bacterium]|nr:SDR family oxidoreductase [Stellaceae bacterium]